jgi:tRNA pseudouridine38-40 synthase
MRTLKLTIAYDGAAYAGWQRQANAVSVQQVMEEAFVPLVGESAPRPQVAGASRTDAGVHAAGQVASIDLDLALDTASIQRALNARLPADVRVVRVDEAPPGFHARFDARAKHYRYRIVTADVLSPFVRGFAWHRPWALDADRMREAAAAVVGEHDFASFQGTGSSVEDTVRCITRVSVATEDAPWHPWGRDAETSPADAGGLVVDVEGTGFLRHMVRILVGTLAEVGTGHRTPASMADVLAARDRRVAGITAPAAGLVLVGVSY